MGIIKYKRASVVLNTTEINNSSKIGSIVKNSDTGDMVLIDGVTPGGFVISDENTLSIEEIIALLDNVYVRQGSTIPKLIPSVITSFWRARSTHWRSGLRGTKMKEGEESTIPNSTLIPDDCIVDSPLDFYFDFTVEDFDSDEVGNVRLAIGYVIAKPGLPIPPITYRPILVPIDTVDEDTIISVNFSDYLTINHTVNPNDLLIYRFIRTGNNDNDTFGEEILAFSFGVKYIGNR